MPELRHDLANTNSPGPSERDGPWQYPNGTLRAPARFALEWKNTTGIDPDTDTDGEGFVAEPRIYLRCESGDDDMVGSCIHSDGFCVYSIVTEPASCSFELHEADEIDGFQILQGKFVSLHVTDEPGDSDYGYIRFGPKYHCWGEADITHGIHRCEGGHHVWCHVCGTYHDDRNACSHAPDCAAVLDASADCTCGGLYVHVAWQDEDGNGTPDLADDHLVGGGEVATFTALGGFIDDCCCRWAYEPDNAEVGETTVAFSNGVTKASGAAPHPDYASFPLALDIPSGIIA